MGLIRKAMSISTLGAVNYRSVGDVVKKERAASTRLINAQARQLEGDPVAEKWEPVVAQIEAGEASWDDLSRMQKLSMPIGYQIRCKAAERRRGKG
jgi:hypothetical protein